LDYPGAQRTCALRIYWIGQDVSCRRLNQKRCMTDKRDDGSSTVQGRWPLRRLVDVHRPRFSPLHQHSQDRREWLSGTTTGIHESSAIKVIAILPSHRSGGGLE